MITAKKLIKCFGMNKSTDSYHISLDSDFRKRWQLNCCSYPTDTSSASNYNNCHYTCHINLQAHTQSFRGKVLTSRWHWLIIMSNVYVQDYINKLTKLMKTASKTKRQSTDRDLYHNLSKILNERKGEILSSSNF